MAKNNSDRVFLGIDVGTQGARTIDVTDRGEIMSEGGNQFEPLNSKQTLPEGWFELSPNMWWSAARKAIRDCISILKKRHRNMSSIQALSVTSTSGTIVVLDNHLEPLCDAIMYNDARASKEADEINQVSQEFRKRLGYSFSASFGLAKILWLKNNRPTIFENASRIVHASDFIVGKICGRYDTSDYSNALKSGYDIELYTWPDFIERDFGIPLKKLPDIVHPGTPISHVSRKCSDETGLSPDTQVVAGMTDGCASQIASGAVAPGNWNTTIGTTLVIKGVTQKLISDPLGRIYSHRHPEGYWMPGGAGNVGGDCLFQRFDRSELETLNRGIAGHDPTNLVIYPLQKHEDRFPIKKSGITGFVLGTPRDRYELFQGYLEGVGLTERLAYNLLTQLGAEVGDKVFSAGGGSESLEWLKIRANILNKTLVKPKITGACMGTAILAASKICFSSISEAVNQMVKYECEVKPDVDRVKIYDQRYHAFVEELKRRGYIEGRDYEYL